MARKRIVMRKNGNKAYLIAGMITALLVLSVVVMIIPSVRAPPPIPQLYQGYARLNGQLVPNGTNVSIWDESGNLINTNLTFFYGGQGYYTMVAIGDNPDTPGKDGFENGETITFTIAGLTADQTGTWHPGGGFPIVLDLWANDTTPDTTPPDTAITSGPSGTIDYNNVTFSWTGSDDVTPTGNLLYSYKLEGYDGSWSSWVSATSKPYNDLPNGSYTFKVKAKDEAGNEDPTPAERSFTVEVTTPPNNPPTVSISNPSDGAVVSGNVTISGTASDPDGNEELVKVEIKIDGDWITASGTTSWSHEWDTTTVSNGGHTIYARSYDGTDHSNIESITVTVDNPPGNQKPIVTVTYPSNGDTVDGTIAISGTASDQDGNETIQKVEIKIDDGEWKVASGITSWNYTWDTTKVDNGEHTIYARAWDGIDYSSIDSVVVTIDNEKEEEGGIPGFEFAFLIIALAGIILFKRKNNKNQQGKIF